MKILFVASEVTPFAKTGGLADVTGSLPKILKEMEHDVRIIMPYYKIVDQSGSTIRKGRKGVEIEMEGGAQKGLLRQTSLNDIPVYLVENREYFQREFLYGSPSGDYPDNDRRFAFFCRAVLQLLKRMDFRPDIIHCHDWQTALIPILLKHEHKEDPFFMRTAVIYTIHNLAYQGIFPEESLLEMGLDPSYFTVDRLEYYGKVNLMKGAILTTDVINTVSETYCREIQTPEVGCGMEGLLQQRGHDLYGIMNGLDYSRWDPETDMEIAKNYTVSTLSGKVANKKRLQKTLGLDQVKDIPLLAMVSRLSAQKGLDIVEPLLSKFEKEKLQLVILGVGDDKYMQLLQDFKATAPRNISINLEFKPHLAHQIYAGSDMFLMPSHYEPCGLGQLIALRYGSVPIVRKTGGLGDSVFDSRDGYKEPNGFTFDEYTSEAFWEAITRALEAYGEKKKWEKMVRNGMNADFSWEKSARKYDELYRKALKKIFA
ncbi:MAG TPA: glycogen synthase GlgA [Geobacteraceae bacterium]|jgi:starch synthase|nr:glycogen synthase GlgA [Geobacteraceae bacterium]